jgi:ABC-2 type transport system permease protein
MAEFDPRNLWIVLRREYLQRVRTRSFVLSTLLTPLFVAAVVGLPSLVTQSAVSSYMRRSWHPTRLAVACADPQLAAAVREELRHIGGDKLEVEIEPGVSGGDRARLDGKLRASELDCYLWLDPAAVRDRRIECIRRDPSVEVPMRWLETALSAGLAENGLAARGIAPVEATALVRPVTLGVRALTQHSRENELLGATATIMVLVLAMFVSLLSYGVMVMRAVLDEKSSRITEILLCAASAEELMAGKIAGIGAVGLTQLAAWVAMAAAAIAYSATARTAIAAASISAPMIAWLALFYVLGYLLYSSLFGAVGAAFNSLDEAQQWNLFLVMPLVACSMLVTPVVLDPNSTLAVVTSMVPLFAPVLLYARVAAGSPPVWQVALGLALLLAMIWFAVSACARIYRVGILMYGKRPSAREILRWLRYT